MSVLNNAPIVDVRKVMSGKDGGLYDENGTLLVSTESFQSSVAVNNQTYQPLGDAQEHGAEMILEWWDKICERMGNIIDRIGEERLLEYIEIGNEIRQIMSAPPESFDR